MRMNGGSRIRHPVWFIWRREISVDSASFRERTLTMPRRERWVWGREVPVCVCVEEGRGVICLPGAHSFHSLQKLWKCPLHTLGSSAERHVGGDKAAGCRSTLVSETRQCYPEVSGWQVYNVWTCILQWLLTPLQKSGGGVALKFGWGEKTGQTAIYATKETIYLGLRIASTN